MRTEIMASEFADVELGDPRRQSRLEQIAERLASNPSATFPQLFQRSCELEGFYRFIESPYVEADTLHQAHWQRTAQRIRSNAGPVLCLHDTTTLTFGGRREQLAIVEGNKRGFLSHVSLAVDEASGKPLGVLGVHSWERREPTRTGMRKQGMSHREAREIPSEMDRWFDAAFSCSERLGSGAEALVHVMDSEGDDYSLQSHLIARELRFVIRGCYDRRILESASNLTGYMATLPVNNERHVALSARTKKHREVRNQPRDERLATLEIRAGTVTFRRPKNLPAGDLPSLLEVNVVHVLERNAPEGATPVEWVLLTTEPIETQEGILRVVNIYLRRWLIEEYFKALKTGCAFEARLLASYATLQTVLALFIPIAWQLLLLRATARNEPDSPVDTVLSPACIVALRAETGRDIQNAGEALTAVARLGGHIKNNGVPGWQVLWRGMHRLIILAQGVQLGFALAQRRDGAESELRPQNTDRLQRHRAAHQPHQPHVGRA